MAAGIVLFDAWWLYRDLRPVPDARAIRSLQARGLHVEAEAALRTHLTREPRDGDARMTLARLLAGRRAWRACGEELHKVPFWWPKKQEALFLEGQAFLAANLARRGEAAWRLCLADDPLHPTPPGHAKAATEGLLDLYALEERWDGARALIWATYDRARPEDRQNILIMRFRTELERIAPEVAASKLKKYVAADPEDWTARRALARMEQALGRPAEADRQIEACLAARPDDPDCWRDRLKILWIRRDMPALVAAVRRMSRSAAIDADAALWAYRGLALEASADLPGAAEAFRRALALNPNDEDNAYRLATVERRLGRRGEAERLIARSRTIREARRELAAAFQAYVDATAPAAPAGPAREAAAKRLAGICRVLGWAREADELEKL